MDKSVNLDKQPTARLMYMVAGWRQWADAGSISSALPEYLIQKLDAFKIGEIQPDGFYLFQVPGTHDLLRPQIKLTDGHAEWVKPKKNEFFFAGNEQRGLVIFSGDEPHMGVSRYVDAFLDAVEALKVRRVAVVAGVYGAMPYDKDRNISCVYSLPEMRNDLSRYAVRFSDYEGGASIGTCLADRAEERGIELLAFYGLVPFYDFSHLLAGVGGIQIEKDLKAWYDIMVRLDHMFGLEMDLSNLEIQGRALVQWVEQQLEELDEKAPHLNVRAYIEELSADFEELTFAPLSDLWERELRDLFEE